jgi:type II secretory pathway component PulF
MATYHYHATDVAGQPVDGDLEAENVQQALAELERRGLSLQSIAVASASPTAPRESKPTGPVGSRVESEILRSHLATTLERGRTIQPAIRAYAEELPPGRQRRQLKSMCSVLENGDATQAAESLAQSPEFWIPLLSSATASPDPAQVLNTFLAESERTDEIRQQWWLTLAYPIALAGLALAVFVALSVFVIPEFGRIFEDFDLELPGLTQFVLELASWFSSWQGLASVALLMAAAAVLLLLNRWLPAARFGWWSDRLRLPFGRRSAMARFSRFTADLLDAGVSTSDALRIASFSVNHSRLQQSAWRLANELETTGKSTDRIDPLPLSTTVFLAMAGDVSTETRVRLLREISACHAERVRIGMSWASGIVEPLGICFVGCVVGTVVLALFIPLVKLIEGLSG